MAKKKFSDLKGVVVEDGKIVYRGDTIFKVELDTMTVKRYTVKYRYKDSNGLYVMYYCDPANNRDFVPTRNTFYGRDIPNTFTKIRVFGCRSLYGLFSTNVIDATNKLVKIKGGKYFASLKEGDSLYFLDKLNKTIIEDTVVTVGPCQSYSSHDFGIRTEKIGEVCCGNSAYETYTSEFVDKSFYSYRSNYDGDSKQLSIYIDKGEAEKALREYTKKKKVKEKNKEKELEIGKPIAHSDNKGNQLSIGDTIAYVRKTWGGHTDISYGIIISESKTKIGIFDEEERKKIRKGNEERNRENDLRGYRYRYEDSDTDGIHRIEKENVLLLKKAKA